MYNSYQLGKYELDKIKRSNIRPSILLHACCGPCATYPIELLNDYFDITIYFNNSNIYPENEYYKRLETIKEYINIFNKEHNANVKFIETNYDNSSYNKLLEIRANDKENGPRCKYCYTIRMKEAYEYAFKNNFDYCCTVMSISRQKDEQIINRIGKVLETKYAPVKFLVHNFKKKGGQIRRDELVKKYNLYDQNYCGCIYSYIDMKNRLSK